MYDRNLYGNKIPIDGEQYTYFPVMLLDSIINIDKKCYAQILLKECKYAIKKKKNNESN